MSDNPTTGMNPPFPELRTVTERNIHQRLNAMMQEISYVQKEKKQGMNYAVVSHDDVTAKVRPQLIKHGVTAYPSEAVYTVEGNRTQVKMIMRFTNIDDPTDFIDVHSVGFGVDTQDKGPGKAMSYACKYAYLKALALETGEDADLDHKTEYTDPNVEAINAFIADTAMASSEEQLREVAASHKESMDLAAQFLAPQVQSAKVNWQKRMKVVKDAAAKAEIKP